MAFTIWDWMKQVTYIKEPWSSFTDEDKEYLIREKNQIESNLFIEDKYGVKLNIPHPTTSF